MGFYMFMSVEFYYRKAICSYKLYGIKPQCIHSKCIYVRQGASHVFYVYKWNFCSENISI